MQANLQLISASEEKTSKDGKSKFTTFKTSEGIMNCFDSKVCSHLLSNMGRHVIVEVEEKGNFKNIKAYTSSSEVKTEFVGVGITPAVAPSAPDKSATMIMSYVKDLVISGHVDLNDFEKYCSLFMATYKRL